MKLYKIELIGNIISSYEVVNENNLTDAQYSFIEENGQCYIDSKHLYIDISSKSGIFSLTCSIKEQLIKLLKNDK